MNTINSSNIVKITPLGWSGIIGLAGLGLYSIFRKRAAKVFWTYPRKWENALFTDTAWYESGIYCITSKHNGGEDLLYIGKAAKSVFLDRLRDHERKWLNDYPGEKYVRFGLIDGLFGSSEEKIADVESGLIHELLPLQNKKQTMSYSYYHLYEIRNKGNRGPMPKVVKMKEHV